VFIDLTSQCVDEIGLSCGAILSQQPQQLMKTVPGQGPGIALDDTVNFARGDQEIL
jgi:hypothetical protein